MFAHKSRIADLYRRHFNELVAFLSRRVATRELAADLVQELFMRLLAREGSLAAVAHERGFLYSSARHLAVEAQRSPRWRSAEADPPVDVGGAEAPSAESRYADQQAVDRLLAVIANLPPRCREAFILHKYEDLSYAEIGARLRISVSSVEKHMMRALDACRAQIESQDQDGNARP